MRSIVCAVVLGSLARTAAAQPDAPPTTEPAPPPPAAPTPPEPEPEPEPAAPAPSPSPAPPPPVEAAVPAPGRATTITAEPAPPAPPPVATPAARDLGFRFGSYGRVIAGTDLRGGKPEPANVVAHGPRIVERSYLELDFSYGMVAPSGQRLRPVITLAFDGTLFHDTGNFDAQPALRNMFLEAELGGGVTAWAGSRMYRGDDIYLFDYWPLDDLNTLGAGVVYRDAGLELAAHAGVNRLEEPSEFQFQQVEVQDPEQGARVIEQLNRQRVVASATAAYLIAHAPELGSYKLKLHGEVHALPGGTRQRKTDQTLEDLPADTGYLIGAEVGTWGYARPERGFRRHLNVFARYARGLAAFDELAPPTSFGADLKASHASELSFGLSGNWDHRRGNVMIGALARRFVDADRDAVDFDDGWEYALDVRPLARLGRGVFAGADLSYQARFPRDLNPNVLRAEDPAVLQIAPMLVLSPMGPSSYDRPQLRLVYRAAYLNDGARDLFVPQDPRHEYTWTHFLGVQAEWWFNSTTYGH